MPFITETLNKETEADRRRHAEVGTIATTTETEAGRGHQDRTNLRHTGRYNQDVNSMITSSVGESRQAYALAKES